MMKISPQFDDASLFREPTDAEISQMVDGVAVFSFRPEDLPHYNPSGRYNLFERTIRGRALAKKIIAFHPSYTNLKLREISAFASSNFAGVHMRTAITSKGSQADLFVLKRPSLRETEPQMSAQILGIASTLIKAHIPQEISRYVAIRHEIEHMQQRLNGIVYSEDFIGDYYSELSAEAGGLQEFNRVAQDKIYCNDMLHSMIGRRALAGFTAAPPEYWLAPALSRMFIEPDNQFLDQHDPNDVYKSYAEIRLRVAILADNQSAAEVALQLGLPEKKIAQKCEKKNKFALACSSAYLQNAIDLWDHGSVSQVYALPEELPDSNLYLANFIPQMAAIRDSQSYKQQLNSGDLFQLLGYVYQQGNIDDFTRENIEQILEGASIFTPDIAPTFENVENSPELACRQP